MKRRKAAPAADHTPDTGRAPAADRQAQSESADRGPRERFTLDDVDVLMVFARDSKLELTTGEMADRLRVSFAEARSHLATLVKSGDLVECGGIYRWPTIADASSDEDAESESPASADVSAPTSEQIAEAMIKARGFGGVDPSQYRVGWAGSLAAGVIHSRAIHVLMELDEMDQVEREAVIGCAASLWPRRP